MKAFLDFGFGGDHLEEDIINGKIPQERLLEVTPLTIRDFLVHKAYGTKDIDDKSRPIKLRSSTLQQYKKGISKYMVRKNQPWDEVFESGNPTRSTVVNQCIKDVQKFEVRAEGVATNARRPLEYKEFLLILRLFKLRMIDASDSEVNKAVFMSSLLSMQWHMIGRVDDMLQLQISDFYANTNFDFSLSSKIKWSKNIMEERESPEQIILGSSDPLVCPLLNLAIYLETAFPSSQGRSGKLYGDFLTHESVRRLLVLVLNDDRCSKLKKGGPIGTHSFRKGPATYACWSRVSRDFVNRRGRWRRRKAIVDSYIATTLPYPDAFTAAKLCGPLGACKYALRKPGESLPNQVSASFILQRVVPTCKAVLGDDAAVPLGRALLWAAIHQSRHRDLEIPLLPPRLSERLLAAYKAAIGPMEDMGCDNVIVKIPVVPQGLGDQVIMVELGGDGEGDGEQQSNVPSTSDSYLNSQAILSQQLQSQKQVQETKAEVLDQIHEVKKQFLRQLQNIHSAVKRIAIQPVVRTSARPRAGIATNVDDDINNSFNNLFGGLERPPPVKLYKNPRTLFDLWQEYEFGISGTKPAKEFTRAERGENKSLYCRRNVFWQLMVQMINAGHTSDSAIDKIYIVYGSSLSVTNILLCLVQDWKRGGHPSLRISKAKMCTHGIRYRLIKIQFLLNIISTF